VTYSEWLGLVDAVGRPVPTTGPDGQPLVLSCVSGQASDPTVTNTRDDWLVLHATEPGIYRIGAPYKVPRGSACPSP
jgi:hypothetical protein